MTFGTSLHHPDNVTLCSSNHLEPFWTHVKDMEVPNILFGDITDISASPA